MNYDIGAIDLKEVLAALREGDNPQRKWIAEQLEGVDLREKLKGYTPPPEFAEYIELLCDYLHSQFDLADHRGTIAYVACTKRDGDKETPLAEVTTMPVYLNYRITIDPSMVEDWKDGDFETCGHALCHEHCHVLIEPLWRWARADAAPSQTWQIADCVETLTQRFSRIIFDALPKGWFTPDYLKDWKKRVNGTPAPAPKPDEQELPPAPDVYDLTVIPSLGTEGRLEADGSVVFRFCTTDRAVLILKVSHATARAMWRSLSAYIKE